MFTYLNSTTSLEIKNCRLQGGLVRRNELVIDLKRLVVDHETFEWLGNQVSKQDLVLDLKPNQIYMAFKYARSTTTSIELI